MKKILQHIFIFFLAINFMIFSSGFVLVQHICKSNHSVKEVSKTNHSCCKKDIETPSCSVDKCCCLNNNDQHSSSQNAQIKCCVKIVEIFKIENPFLSVNNLIKSIKSSFVVIHFINNSLIDNGIITEKVNYKPYYHLSKFNSGRDILTFTGILVI